MRGFGFGLGFGFGFDLAFEFGCEFGLGFGFEFGVGLGPIVAVLEVNIRARGGWTRRKVACDARRDVSRCVEMRVGSPGRLAGQVSFDSAERVRM